MHIREDDIRSSVETVWTSMLGLDLEPAEPGPRAKGDMIAGIVQITGAWNGAVLLECSTALASLASARMFGLVDSEASLEQVHDALGELANMVGGCVKTLLAETCFLSLPTVTVGESRPLDGPEVRPVSRLGFSTEGLPFSVTIYEAGNG